MKEQKVALNIKYHPTQYEALFTEANETLFGGSAGGGKALALDAEVITPFGPKRMGDIRLNDQVSNPDGSVARVIGVWPQGERQLYLVTFDDGASVEVDGEHLWNYRIASKGRYRKKEIQDRPENWKVGTTNSLVNLTLDHAVLIPLTKPVQFTISSRNAKARWPIDPYVLGVLIGDAFIGEKAINLTSADDEILDELRRRGFKEMSSRRKAKGLATSYSYRISECKALETLGLVGCRSWQKFIPQRYKIAPLSIREDLLRGLMDTDGYADARGHASFTTTSEQLAKDVQWIAWSLGYKANITSKVPTFTHKGEKKQGRLAYTVWIKGENHERLFLLKRKQERARKAYNGGFSPRTRKIASIVPSRIAPCQCITVDHPNGLFLTNDFIVTHNSYLARVACIFWATQIPNFQAYLFRRLLPDLLKNHVEGPKGFRSMLNPWVEAKLVQITEDEIRFLWNNSRIYLCHCQEEKDVNKYLSSEFHLLVIEEATQFTEHMVRFLRSRARCVGLTIPEQYKKMFPRILYTSNPGGVGHVYFKNHYVEARPPHEVWQTPPEEGGLRRVFIPSRLIDNPSMTQDDPNYSDRLRGLGSPELVKAYLDGDWSAVLGAFYPEFKDARHAIKPFLLPSHWMRFMAYDWGSWDPFSIGWWTISSEDYIASTTYGTQIEIPKDSLICYREWYGADGNQGLKLSISKIASEIERKERGENIQYRVLSVDCFRQRGGPSIAEDLSNYGLIFRKAADDRIAGWTMLRNRLIGRMGVPTIYWFDTCRDAIRLFPTYQHDQHDGEDMDGANDHIAEQTRYAVMSRPYAAQAVIPEPEAKTIHTMSYNDLIELEERRKRRTRWRH